MVGVKNESRNKVKIEKRVGIVVEVKREVFGIVKFVVKI